MAIFKGLGVINSNSGFSVISALVASILTVFGVLSVTHALSLRSQEVLSVNQKYRSLELQQALVRAISDPVNCSCNFNPQKSGRSLSIDRNAVLKAQAFGGQGPTLEIPSVFSNCNQQGRPVKRGVLIEAKKFAFNDASQGLFVSKILLQNIRRRSPANEFAANLTVVYAQSGQGPQAMKLENKVASAQAKIQFTVDDFGNILDCSGARRLPPLPSVREGEV